MNLTKGKISKLYNKKKQSLRKAKKRKGNTHNKKSFKRRPFNLANKTLKHVGGENPLLKRKTISQRQVLSSSNASSNNDSAQNQLLQQLLSLSAPIEERLKADPTSEPLQNLQKNVTNAIDNVRKKEDPSQNLKLIADEIKTKKEENETWANELYEKFPLFVDSHSTKDDDLVFEIGDIYEEPKEMLIKRAEILENTIKNALAKTTNENDKNKLSDSLTKLNELKSLLESDDASEITKQKMKNDLEEMEKNFTQIQTTGTTSIKSMLDSLKTTWKQFENTAVNALHQYQGATPLEESGTQENTPNDQSLAGPDALAPTPTPAPASVNESQDNIDTSATVANSSNSFTDSESSVATTASDVDSDVDSGFNNALQPTKCMTATWHAMDCFADMVAEKVAKQVAKQVVNQVVKGVPDLGLQNGFDAVNKVSQKFVNGDSNIESENKGNDIESDMAVNGNSDSNSSIETNPESILEDDKTQSIHEEVNGTNAKIASNIASDIAVDGSHSNAQTENSVKSEIGKNNDGVQSNVETPVIQNFKPFPNNSPLMDFADNGENIDANFSSLNSEEVEEVPLPK